MAERLAFRGTLYFNNAAVFSHHDVHVGFCGGMFSIFRIARSLRYLTMPAETATTMPFIGLVFSLPLAAIYSAHPANATQAPVMERCTYRHRHEITWSA